LKAVILNREENAASMLKRQIMMLGSAHETVIFPNPDNVLQHLERNRINAVFFDIDGETDWQSVCEMVKYMDESIKLVLMSRNPLNAVKAFEAGASDFLPKPVERERLAKTIDRFVETDDAQTYL